MPIFVQLCFGLANVFSQRVYEGIVEVRFQKQVTWE